jgi:amidase
MSKPISSIYGPAPGTEFTATQIAETNVAKRDYQKEYMEYWNGTASLTGTGRPVDAVITPLAPFAASRHGMYGYYGAYIAASGFADDGVD